eukprot:scaffold3722_cov263-Pinguiococcus_pyrenoidosus.AAC.12
MCLPEEHLQELKRKDGVAGVGAVVDSVDGAGHPAHDENQGVVLEPRRRGQHLLRRLGGVATGQGHDASHVARDLVHEGAVEHDADPEHRIEREEAPHRARIVVGAGLRFDPAPTPRLAIAHGGEGQQGEEERRSVADAEQLPELHVLVPEHQLGVQGHRDDGGPEEDRQLEKLQVHSKT